MQILIIFVLWWLTTAFWWFFAFYKIDNPPVWYSQAKTVCFGLMSNGLPESYGWILLIGGPALLLVTFLAIWGDQFKEYIMTHKKKMKPYILLITVLTLVFCLWVGKQIHAGLLNNILNLDNTEELPENYPVLNKPLPQFDLIDEAGNKITQDTFKGKTSLIGFMFAHCPSMCPAIIEQVKLALKNIDRNDVTVYFITLDPWRDTPASLPALAKKWGNHPQLHFLSGAPEAVSKVIEDFGIPSQRNMQSGDIVHPPMTFVINANGLIHYALNSTSGRQIASAINKTLK